MPGVPEEMKTAMKPVAPPRGMDFGAIPWVDYAGHRWHFWKPDQAWGHFPHHCPPCQRRIYGDLGPIVNAQTHLGKDGHRLDWTGAGYEHRPATCEECLIPTDLRAYPPGAFPPLEVLDAAHPRH